MSTKYPGGLITKNPVTPAGPYETGAAPGVWTVEQALQYTKQGIWPTAGNAPPYIEDVFSTYLYTGNGSTQTITNGIDLSTKGGLLWMKSRDQVAGHMLYDTASNATLRSDSTSANSGYYPTYINPTSSGFFLDASAGGGFNTNAIKYASWTFRKQPKFFDVVTYTGNGTAGQTVAHNLGSFPGAIFVKATSTTGNWGGWVRTGSTAGAGGISLNSTAASAQTLPNSYVGDSTIFYPYWMQDKDTNIGNVNGVTYVAYLFAHNAGGFGLTGTDNVISCGSFTTDGSGNATVNLGYEPQFVLWKPSSGGGGWNIFDSMRGFTVAGSNSALLQANSSAAESSADYGTTPYASGFSCNGALAAGTTAIYIAIRRGPMKVPTDGTKVFNTDIALDNATPSAIAGFVTDMMITSYRNGSNSYPYHFNVSRLVGSNLYLTTDSTNAELGGAAFGGWDNMVGSGTDILQNYPVSNMAWMWRRAPSFFDEVCYTGTGSARTISHNLGVAPELMIVKCRSGVLDWTTYQAPLGASPVMRLNSTIAAFTDASVWNGTAPTSSVFSVGTSARSNDAGSTFVIYLFASCPGVSKVGSYTGTGATQTISCGFTGGARFVLIKRTDSTGDWYVWDTARGMVSGTDPSLLLNSTAAEVNANSIYTTTGGFQIVSTAAGINASGGTYIFLSIA